MFYNEANIQRHHKKKIENCWKKGKKVGQQQPWKPKEKKRN